MLPGSQERQGPSREENRVLESQPHPGPGSPTFWLCDIRYAA